jgi:hypothetical protein
MNENMHTMKSKCVSVKSIALYSPRVNNLTEVPALSTKNKDLPTKIPD